MICSVLTAIFAVVPFAIWENKVCSLLDDNDKDCNRSWSYGFQVTAWLGFMFSAVIFLLGKNSE